MRAVGALAAAALEVSPTKNRVGGGGVVVVSVGDGEGEVNLARFLGGKHEVVVGGIVVGMVGGDGKVGWTVICIVVVGRPTLLRAAANVLGRGNISGEYVESGVVCDDESEVVCEDFIIWGGM